MSYSVERKIEIWNNKTGDRFEVGPDRDGLDLVEIRELSSDGKLVRQITFTHEEARLVARALLELANE